MKSKNKKEKNNLFKNLKYVFTSIHKDEKGFLFLNILSVFITSIYGFIPAYALKIIIDNLNTKTIDSELIKKIIIEIAIILSIGLFLNLIRLWIDNIAWVRIIRLRGKLIIKLNEKILGLDYQTLEKPETQDLIEKAKNALGSNWEGYEGMYNYMKNLLINLTSSLIACSIIFTAHFSGE